MKALRFCLLTLAIVALIGCDKKSQSTVVPASNLSSSDNLFVSSFVTADSLISLDLETAKKRLQSNGWTLTEEEGAECEFEKEVSDAYLTLYVYKSQKGSYATVIMTPKSLQTSLQDYSKFKVLIDKIGLSYKISSGKICTFYMCDFGGESEVTDYRTFYESLNDYFSQGFEAAWESGDESSVIYIFKDGEEGFGIEISSSSES